ncbi:MAG: hypothetical protein LBV18_03955 [Alistipes sp.]|nr:hypothetical protein [Alistipes sp.]
MKILRLPIKAQWYGKIYAGLKGDEYRDIKGHYISRFFEGKLDRALHDLFETELQCSDAPLADIAADYNLKVREYDAVELTVGYRRDAPKSLFEWKGLSIGEGRIEWGAEPGKRVFRIHLGNRITNTNT